MIFYLPYSQQNQLIQEWDSVHSHKERRAEMERKWAEMSGLWSKFSNSQPILKMDHDPKSIVQCLEKSYETLSQLRNLNTSLSDSWKTGDDPTWQSTCASDQEKIGRIETIFQTLITFTKHLVETKTLITNQVSYFKEASTMPKTLVRNIVIYTHTGAKLHFLS